MLSIVTPVLNGARFIERNILAIKQLNIPFEHIIVDGGSTDTTLEIISKYKHIKLLHQEEATGMYGAIHQGFLSAKHQYITWINADDMPIPDNFSEAVEEATEKNYDVVYGDSHVFPEDGGAYRYHKANPFGRYFLSKVILPFVQPSSFYKRSLYIPSNYFNYKSFKIIGDLDFFMRYTKTDKLKVKYISKPLSCFFVYADSLGGKNSRLASIERNSLQKKTRWYDIFLFRISKYL